MIRHALGALLSATLLAGADAKMVRIPRSVRTATDAITTVPARIVVNEFLMGTAEVTQAEYAAVMGSNPAFHKGPDLPVENVSWWDAIRYANLRSVQERLEPVYDLATGAADHRRNGYRLPTDAEWQAAYGTPPAERRANLGSSNIKSTEVLARELEQSGTRKAGSFPANQFGLYDMSGNVWEWCEDWFDPISGAIHQTNDPHGPATGYQRILRGGSYITTVTSWARGFRTSMAPEYKSRFTGFRLARSVPNVTLTDPPEWMSKVNQPPPAFLGNSGELKPLVRPVDRDWAKLREPIQAKWSKILGAPSAAMPAPNAKLLATFEEPTYTGRLMLLQVEPDFWERIYVMTPRSAGEKPLPVVITPYYDVDTPAGRHSSGRNYLPPSIRSFGLLAVQRGHMAVGIRWFGESYGEGYTEAVANLKLRHPDCTGLGKWVWDAQRLVDYLYTLPTVDRDRIGIVGQSLGGKMSLYAAAMDTRINAAVVSEAGIGLSFSNYEDYWYLGERRGKLEPGTDQHELLGLIAPRPVLVIGGDSADNDKSWYYINAAKPVFELLGRPDRIGYFNHRKGHTPTPEASGLALDWLTYWLSL